MIKIYKTHEIDDNLWQEVAEGFNESFDMSITPQSLKTGFCISNQLGYAYHAIAIDDETGEIKGFNTFTPTFYKDGLKALLSGSTFVKKKFRKDIFIYGDMIKALREKGKEDGYAIDMGVPNKNSKEYALKFLKGTYVGDLDYYIFPRNISKCIHKSFLRSSDCIVRLFLDLYMLVYGLFLPFYNNKEKKVKYSLIVDENFYQARFKNNFYSHYIEESFSAYYRIIDEEGTKAAYIMDFREGKERTTRALYKSVKYITKKEKPDAILFVGFLRMKQRVLFKVPPKYIPKSLSLVYYLIDKSKKEKYIDMKEKDNWDFSLMNFDVR